MTKAFPRIAILAVLHAGALALGVTRAAASEPALGNAEKHDATLGLHRLGPDAIGMRFEGETATRTWTLYVTADQAQTRARIHIAYSNAVSVMPEASNIEISVNDSIIAQSSIAAGSEPASVDVELPRGLLEPGYNAVRIAVDQRHRVDCSLDATYELWTQLDVATSGLSFPGLIDPGLKSLDDLAAISPDATGATPIQLVMRKDAPSVEIDRAMRIVEALAIRGGYARPVVSVADKLGDVAMLAVAVGAPDEISALGLGGYLPAEGAISVGLAKGSDHALVVVANDDPARLDAAVQQILPQHRLGVHSATASTARAFLGVGGYRVTGGQQVSFKDLGVPTKEFTGRLFRSGFDIVMPPDFYPADYDKLTLLIDAGYRAGLEPSSQLLVRVNEREAAALPLRNPNGDLFLRRAVTVSLGALRPGFNHVSIEAQTYVAADRACPAQSLMDTNKRFVLFDSSQLIVPAIARIARMPNLAITAASGFPYSGADATHLFVPHLTPESIGAAATFLTRLAVGARRPMHTALTTQKLDLLSGSAILMGAVGDFAEGAFERFGLDHNGLRDGWAHLAANPPSVEILEAPIKASAPPESGEVYDHWSDTSAAAHFTLNPIPALKAWFDRYIALRASDFAFFRDPDEKFAPESKADLVMAQARAPSGGRDTWTLIAAPSEAALVRDMRSLSAPSAWNRIEGRAIAFDPKTADVTVSPAVGGYFIETASLTPGNLRLVAAGWLSSNVDIYVIVLVVAALLLGVLTNITVRLYGVRT